MSLLAAHASFDDRRAAFLDTRAALLEGTRLNEVRVAEVQGTGIRREEVPPTIDASAPTSDEDAAEAAPTPTPADVTLSANAPS
jgi:hypothetical protein